MSTPDLKEHDFTLVIDRPITDDEIDALYDAGCDDATPEVERNRTLLHFTRDAPALANAIASAVLAVERAGLVSTGVDSNDLVQRQEIAARTGRTPESIRLLAAGERGPGGFPPAQHGFYSWVLVRAWFALYDPAAVGSPTEDDLDYDRTIAAADHVVRARALMQGHAHGLEALLPA